MVFGVSAVPPLRSVGAIITGGAWWWQAKLAVEWRYATLNVVDTNANPVNEAITGYFEVGI
jgi:hypothetical protein